MDVEHLWKYSESDFNRQSESGDNGAGTSGGSKSSSASIASNPLLASAGLANGEGSNPDLIANLCNVADHRLYKIVKWCKSLPLFKNISVALSVARHRGVENNFCSVTDRRPNLLAHQLLVRAAAVLLLLSVHHVAGRSAHFSRQIDQP